MNKKINQLKASEFDPYPGLCLPTVSLMHFHPASIIRAGPKLNGEAKSLLGIELCDFA
jgi:hypothetical protein